MILPALFCVFDVMCCAIMLSKAVFCHALKLYA